MQESALHRMPAPPAAAMPPPDSPSLPSEEQARADLYALCARLLLAPPDEPLLDALAAADPPVPQRPGHPLEQAWERLATGAALVGAAGVRDEFGALFTGIGTPLLNPYGSLYLAGFLMEKPLARLRNDLAALGLARAPGSGELEDHLGALCETMRVLVAGVPGSLPPQPVARQKRFFDAHLAPWYERCLQDIRDADGANFYRLVAGFVQAFLDLEAQAFAIEANGIADDDPAAETAPTAARCADQGDHANHLSYTNRPEPIR